MTTVEPVEEAWVPSAEAVAQSNLTAFTQWLEAHRGLTFDGYESLWRWSVEDLDGFWSAVVEFYGVSFTEPAERVLAEPGMPGAEWFPGARLNYADQVFAHTGDQPAVVSRCEGGRRLELSRDELRARAGSVAGWLEDQGVVAGDRVVAYAPNIAEMVVCFLATASIGAVWSVLLPGVLAAGRGRPVRPARAGGPDRERRLPLRRQGARPTGARGRAPAAAAERPVHPLGRAPRRRAAGRLGVVRRGGGDGAHLRAAPGAVRPPAVGALLQRHHRSSQGHRARPRRHRPGAPEAARPPLRREGGVAVLLVHQHQLDDVELPGRRAPARRHDRPATTAAPAGPARTRCGSWPRTSG